MTITLPQATIDRLNAERTIDLEVYRDNGFESRAEYLIDLAENAGVDFDVIEALLTVLPPDEDFDGLATAAEDAMLTLEGF